MAKDPARSATQHPGFHAMSHSGGKSSAHPGFKAVQNSIAQKENISQDEAGAILASRTRNASKAAHKANLRLNRVKGYENAS